MHLTHRLWRGWRRLAISLFLALGLSTFTFLWLQQPAQVAGASAAVVGTFAIHDHGQGGWVGGPLRADGTVGGGGAFSISTPGGQVVARETGGTWSGTLATGQTVVVCINLHQLQGPPGVLPPTLCAPLPVNAGTVNLFGDTFGRVTTTG
jgi:hypothetical protein